MTRTVGRTWRGAARTPVGATAVLAALLVALGLLDAVAVELSPSLLLFAAVAVLALVGVRASGRRAGVATAAAVVVSLAGTALLTLARNGAASFGLVEALALLLLLVAHWRRASTGGGRALTAALVVALLALPLRVGPVDAPTFVVLMVAVVAIAGAVAVALRGQDAQRRAAVAEVRRSEREEVARELHDVVAHHVTGIVVATQAARAVGDRDPSAAAAALESIEAAGSEALDSMRRLVGVLRADGVSGGGGPGGAGAPRLPTPGVGDLPDLVRRFRDAGAVGAVELRAPEGGGDLPAAVQAALYRVVQEGLTNVVRHAAGAARVTVAFDIDRTPGEVGVEVANSAGRRGAPPGPEEHRGGFGVLGMRERVQALGGALSAGPQPGGGWLVRASIPLTAPDRRGGRAGSASRTGRAGRDGRW